MYYKLIDSHFSYVILAWGITKKKYNQRAGYRNEPYMSLTKMANTSPRHMPVFGNVHPITI